MEETIAMIVRALVDNPEAVDISNVERNGTTLIEVRVAPEDMGKLIGKQGRTVRALRTLVHAAGVKHKRRYVLDIVE